MINSRIIGTLAKHVSPALKQELEEDMLAADAWRMLKSRMHQEGIFAKLTAVCIIQGMRLFILKKKKCLVNSISPSILHGMI